MTSGEAASGPRPPTRRWPLVLLLLSMAAGVAIGIYMTWHHDAMLYGTGEVEIVGCAETHEVNCDEVNTSRYSEVLGVPIAVFTGPTYLLVAWLAGMVLLGRGDPRRLLSYGFGVGVLSILYAVFLGLVSKYELGFICLWCFRLYAVNLSIALFTWLAASGRSVPGYNPLPLVTTAVKDLGRWPREMQLATVVFLVLCGISFGGERLWRASLLGEGADLSDREAVAWSVDLSRPCPTPTWGVETEDGEEASLTLAPEDAWRGNPEADVVAVLFGDFPCPYCKRLDEALNRIYPLYRDRVLFVYKHYAMNPRCNPGVRNVLHRQACDSQRAAVCADRQGAFWEFHDLAYKNNHELDREDLKIYAEMLELDLEAWASCMGDPSSLEQVRADGEAGAALDIHGVPRLYINGERYRGGYSAEAVARALEMALGAPPGRARVRTAALEGSEEEWAPIPEDVPAVRTIRHGDLHYRMHTFEAALDDSGAADSGPGLVPAHRVTWYEARDACRAAGMRLCTEQEWVAACQGTAPRDDDEDGEWADDIIEGTALPYGDHAEEDRCYTGHRGRDERPVYTGSMPGCISADGVYDLVGNMEEWAGLTEESAVLLGGAFDSRAGRARCYHRNDTFGPGFRHLHTGFRCCAGEEGAEADHR